MRFPKTGSFLMATVIGAALLVPLSAEAAQRPARSRRDRLENIVDRREDVRDRREDVRDRREDRRDRRR